ncbi:MAG: Uma2 family endonuclease [Bacteroidota bacterium]
MEVVQEKKKGVGKRLAASKPTTVAEFELWEAKRQPDHNYEFYYGEIIKKPGMKQLEFFIVKFLSRNFSRTAAYAAGAELLPEADVYIDAFRKRIPDLAVFTLKQIIASSKAEKVVPAFAIEILSDSETLSHIETKLQDYFDAGVKLVWYILPKTKKIYAYTAVDSVKIYVIGQSVKASPVLTDFEINIEQLFSIG